MPNNEDENDLAYEQDGEDMKQRNESKGYARGDLGSWKGAECRKQLLASSREN